MNTSKRPSEAKRTSRKYTRRSEAQWRDLINNFAHSDLTQEGYCQQHKISPSGFYAWRKRFESESPKMPNSAQEAFVDITPQLTPKSAIEGSENASWNVELELGTGYVLRIKTVWYVFPRVNDQGMAVPSANGYA